MLNILNRFHKWDINRKQEKLNKIYEQYGLTDEVLDEQVKINSLRNKYDITDENEIINDDGFVR